MQALATSIEVINLSEPRERSLFCQRYFQVPTRGQLHETSYFL